MSALTTSPPAGGANRLSLRVGEELWKRIQAFHLAPGKRREGLSYLWARCERVAQGWLVLLPNETPWLPFDRDCLSVTGPSQVSLRPDVLNGMLVRFAASDFNCLVNVHDHWFASDARFSSVDDADDVQFDRYVRDRFEPMLAQHPDIGAYRPIYNLSVVLSAKAIDARLTDTRRQTRFVPLANAQVLGDSFQPLPVRAATGFAAYSMASEETDRHRGFVSHQVQQRIASWRPAMVGCGGLGSVLSEGLMRLGVRHLTLIDPDVLETTNLNRWQGGSPSDVGKHKAQVLASRLKAMWPGSDIRAVVRKLDHPRSTWAMAAADAVISTIDNDAGRWHLNHLAVQHMLPMFDAGVLITPGTTPDFRSRYFAVIPGVTGCSECKSFQLLDREAVLAGFAHSATTRARRAAGYVQDRPELPTPSAYALNQRASSTAALEILNYFTAWRPLATVVDESWVTQRLRRADRANYPERPWKACPVCSLRTGVGRALSLPRGASPSAAHIARASEPHTD